MKRDHVSPATLAEATDISMPRLRSILRPVLPKTMTLPELFEVGGFLHVAPSELIRPRSTRWT